MPAKRARRGFTLLELLVTMTLLSVLGTIAAKLMMSQQRFFQAQTSQMGIRQELRTTFSALPVDLRSLSSSGGDLTQFTDATVQFRNVLGASIVCAKPNNTTMDLPPLNMARNVLTSWYTQPAVGDSVYAFNEGLLRGAEDDTWSGFAITSITANAALCAASPYTDATLDAGKSRWRVTVSPAIPDSVKIGAGLRFVRSTRYQLAAAASGKWYLNRAEYINGGWSAAVPISGPFTTPNSSDGNGLVFTYFDSLGASVTNPADSRRVARIDVMLRARGNNTSAKTGNIVKDSLTVRIALRNRQ